jgi:hypothetical protein
MNKGNSLLNRLLSSDAKGELLALFHKNPGLVDTRNGVAYRIGKTVDTIGIDIEDFVDLGLLNAKLIDGYEVIYLNHARDKEIQTIITNYIKSLKRKKVNKNETSQNKNV